VRLEVIIHAVPIPRPRPRRPAAALALCLAALLGPAGCGDDDGDGARPEPSVEFIAPTDDNGLDNTVTAVVAIEGFEIDPEALGGPNEDGVGHLRFTMDRGRFDFPAYSGANGRLARWLGVAGQYSPATEPRITYRDLPPGDHRLIVDLVNNDYSVTGVSESITFTVE